VRSEKAVAVAGEGLGNAADRQAGSIGGEQRLGRKMRQNAGQQSGLNFEILGDGLDDPVALRQLRKIVVEVTWGDERGVRQVIESGRLGFCEGFEAGICQRVIRCSFLEAGRGEEREFSIGQVRGNAGAHGSGAQHGGAAHHQRLSGRS